MIKGQNRKPYLLCVLDDYSRLARAQVMEDIICPDYDVYRDVLHAALKRELPNY